MSALHEKILLLLNKAEHANTSPEEAEIFFAKAYALMADNAIDEAVIRQAGKRVDDVPLTEDFFVPGPHANAKRYVFSGIARTNGCKLVISGGGLVNGNCKVYISGYKSDIENTKQLFNSALIFGQSALVNHLKLAKRKYAADKRKADREGDRWFAYDNKPINGNSFAPSFWMGFASTLTDRLSEANKAAEAAATERVGNSVALALVDKKQAVANHVKDKFGRLGKAKGSSSNSVAGYGAGGNAARSFNLNKGVGGGAKALAR